MFQISRTSRHEGHTTKATTNTKDFLSVFFVSFVLVVRTGFLRIFTGLNPFSPPQRLLFVPQGTHRIEASSAAGRPERRYHGNDT